MELTFVQLGLPPGVVDAFQLDLLARLLLAAMLGGLIGLEREMAGKPAGLRTNLLICVGAALLTEISIGVAETANVENIAAGTPFRADPGRIAAQIVSGIGFIGAGTILQSRGNIVGLTTAATIWVVAAIGMAVGAREYFVALGATALVGFSLAMLGRLEAEILRRGRRQRFLVSLDQDSELLRRVEDVFSEAGLRVETESVEKENGRFVAHFEVTGAAELHQPVLHSLAATPGVHRLTRIS